MLKNTLLKLIIKGKDQRRLYLASFFAWTPGKNDKLLAGSRVKQMLHGEYLWSQPWEAAIGGPLGLVCQLV